MPFPRSNLDVYLVFIDDSLPRESLYILLNLWHSRGWISMDGTKGLGHGDFGFGSFHKVQVVESNKSRLFANHQGGYKVCCPINDKIVTVDFISGVARWRAGEKAPEHIYVTCSACSEQHSLVEFVGKPSFAFGRCAFHFSNVDSGIMNSVVVQEIERNVGQFSLVLKRVG